MSLDRSRLSCGRGNATILRTWSVLSSSHRWSFQIEIPSCRETGLWSLFNGVALSWFEVDRWTHIWDSGSQRLTLHSEHKYAALKVSTQLRKFPLKRRRELVVYEHLRKIRSSHPGQPYIRELTDASKHSWHAGIAFRAFQCTSSEADVETSPCRSGLSAYRSRCCSHW